MRLASITFDDGFERSAEVAAPVLSRYGYTATFFVVTGWVTPERASIRDPFNLGRPHGDWDFWRSVAVAGHEIGSHGFAHVNAGQTSARLLPWIMAREIGRSFNDLRRESPARAYTISMPWNAASRLSRRYVRGRFAACRLGSAAVRYNALRTFAADALESWAFGPQHRWADIRGAIKGIPDNSWLILQLHSFDDEGWAPLPSPLFDDLCALLRDEGIKVRTVREAVLG